MRCPNRETLAAYTVGRLPEETADAVTTHIEQCPQCAAVLETLSDASDGLLAQLRLSPTDDQYAAEAQCREALARAKALADVSPSHWSAPAEAATIVRTEQLVPERLGEYEILAKLGEGGMGAVYRARHTKLDRIVALKVLPRWRQASNDAATRFEREMQAAGRLNHSNIVQAYDAREIDGIPVLAMEYVDGLDLSNLSARLGPLPIADACELIRQAAVGLQAAADLGLVHRDIKPSNVMLSRAGCVKVLDLGLARIHAAEVADDGITSAHQVMGTADYMAPEQVSSTHTVDIRADIYSLGCTFYKLLTGQSPFCGPQYAGSFEKMMGHVRDVAPPLRDARPDVPAELAALVDRLMAKDPAARPAAPRDVAEWLAAFARGSDLPRLLARAEDGAAAALVNAAVGATPPQLTLPHVDTHRHTAARPAARAWPRIRWFGRDISIVAILVTLGLLGAAVVGGAIYVITDRGTLAIRTLDDDVSVQVSQNGREVTVVDTKLGKEVRLPSGVYEANLSGGREGLRLTSSQFTIYRGKTAIVEVEKVAEPGRAVAGPGGEVATTRPAGKGADELRPLLLANPPLCWTTQRFDAGGTSFFPRPSQRRTGLKLERYRWSAERPLGRTHGLLTGDLDGDGYPEVIVSEGATLATYDRWGKLLWRCSPVTDSGVVVPAGRVGMISSPGLAAFRGRGRLEIVVFAGSYAPAGWSQMGPVATAVYDANGTLLRNLPMFASGGGQPQYCFDFDGDGRPDIVLATGTYRHPHALCIQDYATGKILWRHDFADGPVLAGVGDVAGDGRRRMLAIVGFDCHVDPPVDDYDSDHCYAVLFDAAGKRLWKQAYPHALNGCLADLDNDGKDEIIVLHETDDRPPERGGKRGQAAATAFPSNEGFLYLLDPATGATTATYAGMATQINRGWAVADFRGDGHKQVAVGDGQSLHLIDAAAKRLARKPCPGGVVAATNDLNGDGHVEIIVRQGADLVIFDGDLNELARFTASGRIQSAIVTDLDGDGINEVLLETGEGEDVKIEVIHFAAIDAAAIDVNYPLHVARAYFAALRDGQLDRAAEQVLPSQRERFLRQQRAAPARDLPAELELKVSVHVDDGQAEVAGAASQRVELRRAEGRWWISDF